MVTWRKEPAGPVAYVGPAWAHEDRESKVKRGLPPSFWKINSQYTIFLENVAIDRNHTWNWGNTWSPLSTYLISRRKPSITPTYGFMTLFLSTRKLMKVPTLYKILSRPDCFLLISNYPYKVKKLLERTKKDGKMLCKYIEKINCKCKKIEGEKTNHTKRTLEQ